MSDSIRFVAPDYPGGPHCLMRGSVTIGAVYAPNGARTKWLWHLMRCGANSGQHGEAEDEDTAKGHLTAALALTLAEAGLAPIADPTKREEKST